MKRHRPQGVLYPLKDGQADHSLPLCKPAAFGSLVKIADRYEYVFDNDVVPLQHFLGVVAEPGAFDYVRGIVGPDVVLQTSPGKMSFHCPSRCNWSGLKPVGKPSFVSNCTRKLVPARPVPVITMCLRAIASRPFLIGT